MRGYGRDYDNRNWVDRAGETVRGWFGGGRDYDRDYGWSGSDRDTYRGDWSRGPDRARPGEGYRTNNWNNQHANWDTVDRAGSYYGTDYQDRQVYRAGGAGYDRDFGRDRGFGYDRDFDGDRDRMQGGHRWMEGLMGGSMEPRGGMDRGMTGGGMDRGMSGGGMDRGMRGTGQGGTWMGAEYGGGYGAGLGDYGRGGAFGGGGRMPGRYFRGYGVNSTGGRGYEPY